MRHVKRIYRLYCLKRIYCFAILHQLAVKRAAKKLYVTKVAGNMTPNQCCGVGVGVGVTTILPNPSPESE